MEAGGDAAPTDSRRPATDQDKRAQRERQYLLLSRTYILRRIEASSSERYTESLRQALNDIDKKLAALDG
jgi:hypothetical protein